ncbi:hypothetical protein ACFTWN_31705 [Streptomyces sp. NPDC057092]|uniref:hypothetical protein n=1 Tax=Streptomyces sp. NPDC057092 TaxID=3346017 RepID=UPI003624CD23
MVAVVASSQARGKGKNSVMLARRKAALGRAAERMAERRREAQEAEAQRLRQEAAFDELVADFELAVEDEAAAVASVEEEIARVRERGQVRIGAARVAAARIVLAMGEAGETVAGCALRLGVGVERVKELRRLAREDQGTDGAAPGTGKAGAAGRAAARRETAGGPSGEQRLDDGRAAGQTGTAARGAGAAAVTAPPAPGSAQVRSASSGGPSTGAPAGPSAGAGW